MQTYMAVAVLYPKTLFCTERWNFCEKRNWLIVPLKCSDHSEGTWSQFSSFLGFSEAL